MYIYIYIHIILYTLTRTLQLTALYMIVIVYLTSIVVLYDHVILVNHVGVLDCTRYYRQSYKINRFFLGKINNALAHSHSSMTTLNAHNILRDSMLRFSHKIILFLLAIFKKNNTAYTNTYNKGSHIIRVLLF